MWDVFDIKDLYFEFAWLDLVLFEREYGAALRVGLGFLTESFD